MKKKILSIFLIISCPVFAQQIKIERIEQMPNKPEPYIMRNWKQVALDYDSIAFNFHLDGKYLPLTFLHNNSINFPDRESYFQKSYVGNKGCLKAESVSTLMAIIGSTLCGMDMTNFYGKNWVMMSEDFFNSKSGLNLYGNIASENPSTGSDWWYETIPNILFYQLYYLYPQTGNFKDQFTIVANKWIQCISALGGRINPRVLPNMNHRSFNFNTMTPYDESVKEPEAAGALGWIFYNAYIQTKKQKYLDYAKLCIETFSLFSENPSYELQYLYGTVTAARMNAEQGTTYDIEKMMNWCFDVGTLRKWRHLIGWGASVGKWGSSDACGLIGGISKPDDTEWGDFSFLMNTMQQIGILPVAARYDSRFARAIGKYILNAANSCRLFYSAYLPAVNQDKEGLEWAVEYDRKSSIGYEALRQYKDWYSPFATGDATLYGWNDTNLGLYSSASVGYVGGIVEKTDIEAVLKIDLLKTDFFHAPAYPTYLYYNPYDKDKKIKIDLSEGYYDIYDTVSKKFLNKGVSGIYDIYIPKDDAVIIVLVPKESKISCKRGRLYANNIIIDYQYKND